MEKAWEDQKRDKFKQLLFELARSQELLRDSGKITEFHEEFEALYYSANENCRFRHFYSDIFFVLTDIKKSPEKGDINTLAQNLQIIRESYSPCRLDVNGNLIDVSQSLLKLYDHLNLDMARLVYIEAGDYNVTKEDNIDRLTGQINAAENEIKNVRHGIDAMESKVRDSQKEYIAILGIFAAVVLTFIGGLAFSTSVLNNINAVSIYRLILIATVIGLILVNVLYALFHYLNIIVRQNNSQSLKPLKIINIIIISMIAITVLAWCFGLVEYRDKSINEANVYYEQRAW